MTSLAPPFSAPRPPAPPDRRGGPTNRRRFTRVPARQLRGCLIARGVVSDNVWVVDISLGGAFLRTPEPLPINEPLALELPQSGQRPSLRLLGHVVSRRVLVNAPNPPGMGICFDRVSPMSLVELRELIRTFAPSAPLEMKGRDEEETTRVSPLPSAPTPPPIAPLLTAAPVMPLSSAPPPPTRPAAPPDSLEVRQLRTHVKGLLTQVNELQDQLSVKSRENESLREAITRLQVSNAALRRGII